MNQSDPGFRTPHLLRRGKEEDFLVLLPVGDKDAGKDVMIRFCRRISPRSAILEIDLEGLFKERSVQRERLWNPTVTRLVPVIADAIKANGLALLPLVIVGHGEGADLASHLILSRSNLFAAGVLFRPRGRYAADKLSPIEGLQILLAQITFAEEFGLATSSIRRALTAAGAEVICEKVLSGQKPSSSDAAIARIFIAALFGS